MKCNPIKMEETMAQQNKDNPQASPEKRGSDFLSKVTKTVKMAESSGKSWKIGDEGERGWYQFSSDLWREATIRVFGEELPFERAHEEELSTKVFHAEIQRYIDEFGEDPRLVTSAWNRGFRRAKQIRAGEAQYLYNHINDIYRYVLNSGQLWEEGVEIPPRK